MKNLNLNAYGVEGMSQQEMLNENGGFWGEALKWVGLALAAAFLSEDTDSLSNAWDKGYNSVETYSL